MKPINSLIALVLSIAGSSLAVQVGVPHVRVTSVIATQPTQASATVTLLNAGAEPRKPLRLSPALDRTQVVTISLRATLASTRAGVASSPENPSATLSFNVTPTKTDASGKIHYNASCTSVQAPDSVAPGDMADLQSLTGVTFKAVVDARGIGSISASEGIDGLSASARLQVESLGKALSRVGVVFPDEAVGAGASWRVVDRIDGGGVSIVQTTTVTLERFDGRVAVFSSKLEQTAPVQKITAGDPPVSGELRSLVSSGTSRTVQDLELIAPIDATGTLTSRIELLAQRDGKSETVTQDLTITTSLTSKLQ